MLGRSFRKRLSKCRRADKSFKGCTGRTNWGSKRSPPGHVSNTPSSEPSGPRDGPEIRVTSRPGFCLRPRTEATVFSWAPPTINRVMTWITRIAGSEGTRSQVPQPGDNGISIDGIGRRIGQGQLIILDRRIGIFAVISDLPQPKIRLEGVGVRFANDFEIRLGLVELFTPQIRPSAHKNRQLI